MRVVFLSALALVLFVAPIAAGPQSAGAYVAVQRSCPGSGSVPAKFSEAVTGTSFRAEDGREIRLAGVIGPGEDREGALPDELAAARVALASVIAAHGYCRCQLLGGRTGTSGSMRNCSQTVSGFKTRCFVRVCCGLRRKDRQAVARQPCWPPRTMQYPAKLVIGVTEVTGSGRRIRLRRVPAGSKPSTARFGECVW